MYLIENMIFHTIHVATIINNGLQGIASGDKDFDKIGIKRLWIKTHKLRQYNH